MPERNQTDIEERISFQERDLERLGRVVAEQQLELDALQREVRELRAKVAAAGTNEPGEGGPRTLEDDRPPHY